MVGREKVRLPVSKADGRLVAPDGHEQASKSGRGPASSAENYPEGLLLVQCALACSQDLLLDGWRWQSHYGSGRTGHNFLLCKIRVKKN